MDLGWLAMAVGIVTKLPTSHDPIIMRDGVLVGLASYARSLRLTPGPHA